MTTGATLLSGGELMGVGMRNAGIDHRWGFEIDPDIAGVAQANGFNVIVADLLDVDPSTLEPVDCLHASPVCTRASTANQSADLNDDGTKEAPLDIAMGEKVAQFIDVLQPRIVTIENVYAYRNFQAFKKICAALDRNGYFWDFDNLNSADFSVPQTRRRLILRAVRGALLPNLPQPEPWIGWYQAIQDLIPTLPVSRFAPWQLERLPANISASLLVNGEGAGEFGITPRLAHEPSATIKADPHGMQRAFIVHPTDQRTMPVRSIDEPMFTVTTNQRKGNEPKAFLVGQQYGSPNDTGSDRKLSIRNGDEPSFTIETNVNRLLTRALLVSGGQGDFSNGQSFITTKGEDEPSMTITAGESERPSRAWLQHGKVVSMVPRALARFQSVPDWYILPASNKLACTVIGNGWPSLMAEKIYRGLLGR